MISREIRKQRPDEEGAQEHGLNFLGKGGSLL